MQNADELIEKYKNDMLKLMKRSYFPYQDEAVSEVSESEPSVSAVKQESESSNRDTPVNQPETEELPNGYGSLKVRVFSGNIAFPIETAFVRVFDGDDREIREGYTNQSGIFDVTMLPTPNKSISESPGSEKAYTGYKIVVTHPRFNTEVFENVPVFSGVGSIQDVRMKLGSSDEEEVTVESEPDILRREQNA